MAGDARDGVLIRPITKERLADFEALMKTNRITGSCWDVFPRRLNAEWNERSA